jgi:WD40 repeat protein
MLILPSEIENPVGLSFSPDGLALLAVGDNRVQVWPRWLDAPPHPAKPVQASLERYTLSEDASRVYLYVSGNSYTRVLNLAKFKESTTSLPSGGPSWFHFDADGGFFLVSHDNGKLSRFDHDAKSKKRFRKAWSIERTTAPPQDAAKQAGKRRRRRSDDWDEDEDDDRSIGSHYRFGAICGPAGIFVALEYRYGGDEPLEGLVIRSVADGSLIRREKLSATDGRMLLNDAGLTLSIHPSGRYFAFPQKKHVRLWPLADGLKLPDKLNAKFAGACHAVAFHPSGSLLAAAGSDGTVKLFDTSTWEVARTLAWDIGPLGAVCFSPDGTRGAAITGGKKMPQRKVVVWDVDL